MSDNTNPTPADVAPKPSEPAQAPTVEPKADEVDWKAEARKWEQRAKENKAAAESASKTEAEKVAERLAAVEQRAIEAEARIVRRDVAIEFGLSKEDASLLDAINDEDAMRRFAQRLSTESDKKQRSSNNISPREGNNPRAGTDDEARAFARNLFARAQSE